MRIPDVLLTGSLSAAIFLGLPPSAGEAHELKTKKGGRTVMHAHYSRQGHAGPENGSPAGNHEAKECDPDPWFGKKGVKPGAYVDAKTKSYISDDDLAAAKKTMEDFWERKFPAPPGWVAPPQGPDKYWKTKVKQIVEPTFERNCGGAAFDGGGCAIGSESEYAKFIDDDFTPLVPPEPAAVGMVVVYRAENKDTGPITHVATVIAVDASGPTTVRSAMGSLGTWEHPIDTVPRNYTHRGGGWKVYKAKP